MTYLGTVDWVIFGLVIAVPLAITAILGLYKGGIKSNSAFIMGDRKLSIVPVALSLAVSYLSAVTISGVPGEVSYYGTLFPWTYLLAVSLALVTVPNTLIPVYHKMHLTSVYEYLELRYSSRLVRSLGSLTYLATLALYMGVALYAPCVSLSVATGGPVWAFILACGAISILVTAFGGLKTVVWADAWQAGVMVAGLLSMIVAGILSDPAGMDNIWNTAVSRGRVVLASWTVDPTARSSSVIIFFGQFVQWAAIYGCHQTQVQRYCSTRSPAAARWSLGVNVVVLWVINVGAILTGLVIFSKYQDCDPLATGEIRKTDQLATYYVTQVLASTPGLVGLFLSSLVSGALSSVSSGLNSMASVLWEDFLSQTEWSQTTSEHKRVRLTRVAAGTFGLVCTGLALGFSQLDGVLKVATTSIGMLSGPLLAVFLLGFFLPFNNKVGASVGIILGHGITIWIAVGALFLTKGGRLPTLETSTTGCTSSGVNSTVGTLLAWAGEERIVVILEDANSSLPVSDYLSEEEEIRGVDYLYTFSPFLYPVIGFVVTAVTSVLVSLVSLSCWRPRPPPHLLLHPLARRMVGGPAGLAGGPRHHPATLPADTDRWEDHDSHYRKSGADSSKKYFTAAERI